MSEKRIAIIGGGLLGRFLALELFERGQNVSLFEKGMNDGSSACGFVGLGMISPWSELPCLPHDDTVTFKLGVSSLPLWPHLLSKINSPFDYLNKGCLLISRREEYGYIDNLKKLISLNQASCASPLGPSEIGLEPVVAKPQNDTGSILTASSCYKDLKANGISYYEPEISPHFFGGIFLPQEGCIDSKKIFMSLTQYFAKIKLSAYYNCGECTFTEQNDVFIPSLQETQHFDFVIDTRGLGAKNLQNNLRGVRGETLRVYAPHVNITRQVRVLDSKLPLYIAPRGDFIYSLGATCLESEETKPILARSVLEILSMARYVHEGFMESHILETSVQLRPAYLDNKPKIILKDNFLSVNGLYRHGIMCTPALSILCADLVTKKPPRNFREIIYEN